jgi:hypothetical protein
MVLRNRWKRVEGVSEWIMIVHVRRWWYGRQRMLIVKMDLLGSLSSLVILMIKLLNISLF